MPQKHFQEIIELWQRYVGYETAVPPKYLQLLMKVYWLGKRKD
jgi:hypothetical protein